MESFQVGEKSKRRLTWGEIVPVQSGVQLTRAKIIEENSLLWRGGSKIEREGCTYRGLVLPFPFSVSDRNSPTHTNVHMHI